MDIFRHVATSSTYSSLGYQIESRKEGKKRQIQKKPREMKGKYKKEENKKNKKTQKMRRNQCVIQSAKRSKRPALDRNSLAFGAGICLRHRKKSGSMDGIQSWKGF